MSAAASVVWHGEVRGSHGHLAPSADSDPTWSAVPTCHASKFAAGIQPHGRGSEAGVNLSGSKDQPALSHGKDQPAPSHAKNGPALNIEKNPTKNTDGPAENHIHIHGGGEAGAVGITSRGQQFTADALANLAMLLGGAKLKQAFVKSLPKKTKPANDGKNSDTPEFDLEVFRHQSSVFAVFSGHTTMAAAATAFSLAVERFASGQDNKKRVADTELSKTAMTLSAAAHRAPPSEAIFANLATRLTGDAQLLLLSDAKPLPQRSRWRWRPAAAASDGTGRTMRMERLLAARISSPDPVLPVHTAKGGEKELIDKRQIMYAMAVALPVSLLASAAGVRVFEGGGAWAAGAGVVVWTISMAGMVLNQYGKLNWELLAARHLNRVCLLGSAILLSFYAFRAYFPLETWALWFLVAIAVVALGIPWIMSIFRADDTITRNVDMVERARKSSGKRPKLMHSLRRSRWGRRDVG